MEEWIKKLPPAINEYFGETVIYVFQLVQLYEEEREALVVWRVVHTWRQLLQAVKDLPEDTHLPGFWVHMIMNEQIVGNAHYTILESASGQFKLNIDHERGACQGLSDILTRQFPLWHPEEDEGK